MCGIVGMVDLRGREEADAAVLERMAAATIHRGPDEQGFFYAPGLGLASRRLSIIGLADGQQPIYNEDRTVSVVFNGELFEYRERRDELTARGHKFRTSADTEILVHLWEEYGERMFEHLRGQFAFALYDETRQVLILARDRVGICPLHWSRQGDWMFFASEIKGLLASGRVPAAADPRGLDHIFTFFGMPTRRTAFEGVSSVVPGHYLKFEFQPDGERAKFSEHTYWDFDFPDRGQEEDPADGRQLIDEFRQTFYRAVDIRLRADVPVVGYLSGGIDSAAVMAVATQVMGRPVPSFTVRIDTPRFDETDQARMAAQTIGSPNTVITGDARTLAEAYPRVIAAADCPVVDTACVALYLLSGEVHRQGFKVALTGEGSDEALAGYPWFKIHKLMRVLDWGPLRPFHLTGRLLRRLTTPAARREELARTHRAWGGSHAQTALYHLVGLSRGRFYSDEMFERLAGRVAYEDVELDLERMRRWHPLNQSLYIGYKTILPGLLLNHKGDRVAMANSVETRYPFLDENVIALCARVHPRWKLRRVRHDKYLLRKCVEGFLPREIAARPKAMFRAPLADTFFASSPAYVRQLLSPESLRATPYFDADKVLRRFRDYQEGRGSSRRVFVEMGLIGVLATQLWHHLYLGGGLCDLPTRATPRPARAVAAR